MRQLLCEKTAGDPMAKRGLWTDKRLETFSQELSALGIWICPNTVRHLLKKMDYSLHANLKSISGATSPNRDQQFLYIDEVRKKFTRNAWPIISVDTKKKELVGNFKNNGRVWSQKGIDVNDHDFRSQAQGIAISYGIYDTQANHGFVVVGNDHDTPEFAVQAIVHWWINDGQQRYGQVSDLLILADGGGSNGARCRLWKYALQEKLVDPFELRVTVCHYPPGASKWNPIEHRLFSEISKNWAGLPLKDYPTIVQLISQTQTKTGLTVDCVMDTNHYPSGIKVSNQQMQQLNINKHAILPDWNYTLSPRNNRN